MNNNFCKLAVLISGSGSNLQSLIDNIHTSSISAKISCVISNNPDAYGLTRAKKANIPTYVVNHKNFTSRNEFESELITILKLYKIDIIALAGFMRILGTHFINVYKNRILNIHPSLLPKYPGLNTHVRVLESDDLKHGCSVHLVTTDLDQGPLIIQAEVPIYNTDEPDHLAKRVLEKEHIIYPLVIKWISENKLTIKQGKIYFEKKEIKSPLKLTTELELEIQ